MRTILGVTTFCVVAAGAIGVSANLALVGSDTIKDTTVALLTNAALDCGGIGQNTTPPNGSLSYLGTGSGNGEAAMLGNVQQVAPMSRRLGTAACTGTSTSNPSRAEGIVFALDGISVVANSGTVGTCTGTLQQAADGSQCGADSPAQGLKFSGSLSCGLTLTSWKDVLRLIYFGYQPGASTAPSAQNCSDPCRTELLNNYAEIFQASCALGAGCTQLWHAFRRNDESGTTDDFVTSIGGVTAISLPNNYTPFCNSATNGPAVSMVGIACSAAAVANDGICSRDGTNATVGTCDTVHGKCTAVSCDADADCTTCNGTPPSGICNMTTHKCNMVDITSAQALSGPNSRAQVLTGVNTVNTLAYYALGSTPPLVPITQPVDMQDADPVRRLCLFQNHHDTETVCGADRTLGVVLPIWDATETSQNIGTADAFPTTTCGVGTFGCAPAVRISRSSANVNIFALCPDGTDPNVKPNNTVCALNQCYTPQAGPPATPNFACINSSGNVGATHTQDGRVYNLTVWKNNQVGLYPRSTGQCAASPANTTNLTPMYRGAYFRLHQNFVATGAPAGAVTCQASSATDQISCLVQASPCSIGYAGNSAATGNTVAINVNNIAPSNACIQNLLTNPTGPLYPFSRKLYFNTIAGFETLSSGGADQQNEFKLSLCFARKSGLAGSAEDVAVGLGFIPLPTTTKPFCDDVANDLCGTGSACANNPSGIPVLGYPNPPP
jgi:ABC-type phosphate transport system substrate-binding protein